MSTSLPRCISFPKERHNYETVNSGPARFISDGGLNSLVNFCFRFGKIIGLESFRVETFRLLRTTDNLYRATGELRKFCKGEFYEPSC